MIELEVIVLATMAGMATSIGALFVFFINKISHRLQDTLLGLSAGLMLSVTALNLIPAALGANQRGIIPTLIGLSLGGLILFVIDAYVYQIPKMLQREGPLMKDKKKALMILIAITIHNFPEGFATGTAYSQGVTAFGNAVALAIALQNIPEGLIVAVPFRSQGFSRLRSFNIGFLTGVVEPLCAILAVVVVGFFAFLLPYAFAFASGAMLYVIFDEMIPESHSHGYAREATGGFLIGFVIMTALNYLAYTITMT